MYMCEMLTCATCACTYADMLRWHVPQVLTVWLTLVTSCVLWHGMRIEMWRMATLSSASSREFSSRLNRSIMFKEEAWQRRGVAGAWLLALQVMPLFSWGGGHEDREDGGEGWWGEAGGRVEGRGGGKCDRGEGRGEV